jgi:integrase/recombinase XerD
MEFKIYLQRQDYTKRTIESYESTLENIKRLNNRKGLDIEEYTYSELLEYIQRRQRMQVSVRTINGELNTLRRYFDYLVLEGVKGDNPATSVVVKGAKRNKLYNLLAQEKLDVMYKNQGTSTPKEIRDKVILGLLIYQGLSIEELKRINTFNIDLEEGVITIPEGNKSNGRVVVLLSKQLMPLLQYLEGKRQQLNIVKANRLNKLILSEGSDDQITASLATIKKKLKKAYPEFENWQQIRTSVITHRLTTANLRQQQYYFGFKYIDSIECYLEQSVDDLREELDRCFKV